jgi:hypothetical protein
VIFGSCFVLSITNVVLLFTQDAIEFVLQNFGEMNKLWVCNSELANFFVIAHFHFPEPKVRMQHQGAVRDKSRR